VRFRAGDVIAIIVFVGLLVGYIVTLIYRPEYAPKMAELLSIVVVAIVSFYLGYSKGVVESTQTTTQSIAQQVAHITKPYLRRLGYIAIGFGIALILQHVVCHGVDLELPELLVGHEFIGLYCLIAGMVMVGLTKKLN